MIPASRSARLRIVVIGSCLALSVLLIAWHVRSMAGRRNALDQLESDLAAVKERIPPGERLVFITDRKAAGREELMLRTQFVLAPRVICGTNGWRNRAVVIDGDRWLEEHAGGWSEVWQGGSGEGHAVLIDLNGRP